MLGCVAAIATLCLTLKLPLSIAVLLRTYASIDPRARALGLLVKMWAKQNDVANPPAGTLSSYCTYLQRWLACCCSAHTPPRRATATHHDLVVVPRTAAYILMVISFLQRRPTPILPNLQCPNLMQRYEAQGGSVEPMDGENGLVARFITDASWAQEATVVNDAIVAGCRKDCACARVPMSLTLFVSINGQLEHGLNDESLSQLFQRFFAFYCTNRTFLVNLREPDTRDVPVPPTCSIVDPLEVDRDLGMSCWQPRSCVVHCTTMRCRRPTP